MTTPWKIDDVGGAVPWKIDDLQGGGGQVPWKIDDLETRTFGGAVGETLKQMGPSFLGGALESAGDLLAGRKAPMDLGKMVQDTYSTAAKVFVPGLGGPTVKEATELLTNPLKVGHRAVAEVSSRAVPEELKQAGETVSDFGQFMADEANLKVKAATPDDLGMLGQVGLSIAQSVALTAPAVVASRVGLASPERASKAVLGAFWGSSFADTYHRAKEAGQDPSSAFGAAVANAAVEVGTEKMALGTLLKGGSKWFKRYILQEIGSEELATIGQSALERGLYNPKKWDSADEIAHDLAVTALAAAGGAGIMKGVDAGTNLGMSLYERKRQIQEFETEAAATELQQSLARAQGIPDEVVPRYVEPTAELTQEEQILAKLQRKQLREGLAVEPTTEGTLFGAQLDEALAKSGLGLPTEIEEGDQADEGGMSQFVLENRQRRQEQNMLPFSKRQISYSATDPRVVGLTLEQTGKPGKGSVVAVGFNEDLFPGEVVQPVLQSLHEWVQKYMPEASVVLNLEQLPDGKFGNYTGVAGADGRMTHVITMRELPSWKYQGGDVKTRMAAVTALTHEFGHALKVNNFYAGVSALGGPVVGQLRRAVQEGAIDDGLLARVSQVAPEEAALLRTWQTLRGRVLDGTMSAMEFMEQWVGLRKLGESVNPARNPRNVELMDWARQRLASRGKYLESSSAFDLVQTVYGKNASQEETQKAIEYGLNFDEFMAEQFSRAAYTTGTLETSALGKFMKTTMEALRNLFRTLKAEKIIQPTETFQAWLDKQTARAQAGARHAGRFRLPQAVKDAQKKLVGEVSDKKPEPQVTPAAPPPDVVATQPEAREQLEAQLGEMNARGVLTDIQYDRFMGKLERGEIEAVRASLQRMHGDEYHDEREYSSKVLQMLPNKAFVKAETLRANLARAEIKAVEKAFWEGFLATHPNGASKLEIEQAFAEGLIPLDVQTTKLYGDIGDLIAKRSSNAPMRGGWSGYSAVYTNPMVQSGERGTKHFQRTDYVMHARRFDYGPDRYILELQNDVMQKDSNGQSGTYADDSGVQNASTSGTEFLSWWEKQKLELESLLVEGDLEGINTELQGIEQLLEYPTGELVQAFEGGNPLSRIVQGVEGKLRQAIQENSMEAANLLELAKKAETGLKSSFGKAWWERLIREEVSQAVGDRKSLLYFPTAETVAAVEGWEVPISLPKLSGERLDGATLVGSASYVIGEETVYLLTTDPLRPLQLSLRGGAELPEGVSPALQEYVKGQIKLQGLAQYQGLMDMYRQGVEKYVKKKFNAQSVQQGDYSWLRVDLLDKTEVVEYWDRENPLQPDDPAILLDTYAGLSAQDLRDTAKVAEAEAQWKQNWIRSPFFKRWFADSKVVGGLAEPLKVFAGVGSPGVSGISWYFANLAGAQGRAGKGRRNQPLVRGYWLSLQNPRVMELGGRGVSDEELQQIASEARESGFDGVILKGAMTPLEGTLYAAFSPEQVKQESALDMPLHQNVQGLYWDAESQGQQAAKVMAQSVSTVWDRAKLVGLNLRAKLVDSLMQLQQQSAMHPEVRNLQIFLEKAGKAVQLKNNLQLPAEELVKDMTQLWGNSSDTVKTVHQVLKAEWRQGKLASQLVGKDVEGTVVWGPGVGFGLEQQAQVHTWEVLDTIGLREFLLKQGVDPETESGKAVLSLYLKSRNMYLGQFNELGKALKTKAAHSFEGQPLLQKEALLRINGVLGKLLTSPFVPQGNFGKYVLVLKKDQGKRLPGQRRFIPVWKKHFESKVAFDLAYRRAQEIASFGSGYQLSSRVLQEEERGLPMQLPSELLEVLAETGDFGQEQLTLLEDLLTADKYDRIVQRFEKISEQMEGASEDFARVTAAFAAQNANYTWKLRYRFELQQSISAERKFVRSLEKGNLGRDEHLAREVDFRKRMIAQMESSLSYMVSPGNELQGIRSAITLVYLGFNAMTAVMNLSTILNTYAAVSSEYGELEGTKEWGRSLKQTLELLWYKLRGNGTLEGNEQNELLNVLDQATKDGVIDQSYAYFLAANANASPLLSATGGRANRAAHAIAELGMLPFQSMEKVVRVHSLFTFYKLERKAGAQTLEAYKEAVRKTSELQNSYDPVNRPWIFRDKRAILTMFMSFSQFMGYVTLGGYEKGARVRAEAKGRSVAPGWRGTTMKLWIIYGLLGGALGLPFARNLMDVFQWLGRKFNLNAESELRGFLEELGVDANFALHGLLHDAWGFDLSGRFGLGRMLPATDLLTKEKEMNALETIGSLVTAGAGPAGNFYKGVTESLGYLLEDPTSKWGWLNAGKAFPGAIGYAAKTSDAYLRQEYAPTYAVTTKDGRRMTWDKAKGEFRDLSTKEFVGMLLGANPTILSENREQNFAVMSEVFYWQTRRSDLMDRYWQAFRTQDMELRVEVQKAIAEYNGQVPDRKLGITGKDLRLSTKAHLKQREAGERYGTALKKYREQAGNVRQNYMEGGE